MSLISKIKKMQLAPGPADDVLAYFKTICEELQGSIFGASASPNGLLNLEPGFTTAQGLGYKVVIKIPKKNYEDVLFRFFVPPTGYPVALDLWGEKLVMCADQAAVDQSLSDFLDDKEVIQRLKSYAKLAG